MLHNWYPPIKDLKFTTDLHVLSILEYVEIYLHRQNILIVSVQIIVMNFITPDQINFEENLQYLDF